MSEPLSNLWVRCSPEKIPSFADGAWKLVGQPAYLAIYDQTCRLTDSSGLDVEGLFDRVNQIIQVGLSSNATAVVYQVLSNATGLVLRQTAPQMAADKQYARVDRISYPPDLWWWPTPTVEYYVFHVPSEYSRTFAMFVHNTCALNAGLASVSFEFDHDGIIYLPAIWDDGRGCPCCIQTGKYNTGATYIVDRHWLPGVCGSVTATVITTNGWTNTITANYGLYGCNTNGLYAGNWNIQMEIYDFDTHSYAFYHSFDMNLLYVTNLYTYKGKLDGQDLDVTITVVDPMTGETSIVFQDLQGIIFAGDITIPGEECSGTWIKPGTPPTFDDGIFGRWTMTRRN